MHPLYRINPSWIPPGYPDGWIRYLTPSTWRLSGARMRTSYLPLFISSCTGISRQLTLVIWVVIISRQNRDLHPWASATVLPYTLPPPRVIRSKQLSWVSLVSTRAHKSSFIHLTRLLSLPICHLFSLNAKPSGSTSSYWCQGPPFVPCN